MHKSQGFTLIEMMIVIAIVAILVSIVVPQFSGVGKKAETKPTPVKTF